MGVTEVLDSLYEYGPVIIAIIMYLEGLNLTGIPAVVIMPTVGIYISQSSYTFIFIFIIAVSSSILGNLTYYGVAYNVGNVIYNKLYKRFSGMRKALNAAMNLSKKYGAKACFIGRLIPGARTFVSLASGILKVELRDFIVYSSVGITLWDFALIFIGYLIGVLYF